MPGIWPAKHKIPYPKLEPFNGGVINLKILSCVVEFFQSRSSISITEIQIDAIIAPHHFKTEIIRALIFTLNDRAQCHATKRAWKPGFDFEMINVDRSEAAEALRACGLRRCRL